MQIASHQGIKKLDALRDFTRNSVTTTEYLPS
jgi:hypothetical protein